jgi:Tfp pilus assembly protein PilO
VSGAATSFRDRKVLFGILLVLLAANVAVLLSYRVLYDARLDALVAEQSALESRRDLVRRGAEEAAVTERKLFETQETLTRFFSETLGEREEQIAPLIEEIYRTTRAAGLRPDAISYSSVDEPGTDSLTMTFSVEGGYADVRRLLSEIERSPRFLVVEQLGLAGGSGEDPDLVRVAFTVTNFFRPGALRPIRAVREPLGTGTARGAAAARTRSTP